MAYNLDRINGFVINPNSERSLVMFNMTMSSLKLPVGKEIITIPHSGIVIEECPIEEGKDLIKELSEKYPESLIIGNDFGNEKFPSTTSISEAWYLIQDKY